ncbi:MAG TPA: capsid cement protein [Bacteroidales bacterium]|nr:capsid cement protein [Bacteroidales bacterium]
MKTEQPVLITSIKCEIAEGAVKHRFIRFNGFYGEEGYKSLGVCNANTAFGEMIPVMAKGIAIVETGGPVNQGSPVESFDDGVALTQTTGPLEGYALDAASGAGELIRILLS